MAFITSRPDSGLAQLNIYEQEKQAKAQTQSNSLNELLNVLQQGVQLAANVTGIAANVQKIQESQTATALEQQKLETIGRQQKGEFISAQDLFQAGGRIIKPGDRLGLGEMKLKGTLEGKPIEYAQLSKERGELGYKEQEVAMQNRKMQQELLKFERELQDKKFTNTQDLRKERDSNKIIQNAQQSSVNMKRVEQLYDQALEILNDKNMSMTDKNLALDANNNALVVAFKQVGEPNSAVQAGEAEAFKSGSWANKILGALFGKYNPEAPFNKVQLDAIRDAARVQMVPHIDAAKAMDQAIERQANIRGLPLDQLGLYNYEAKPAANQYTPSLPGQSGSKPPISQQSKSDLNSFIEQNKHILQPAQLKRSVPASSIQPQLKRAFKAGSGILGGYNGP